MRRATWLLVAGWLTGCASPAAPTAPPYEPITDMKQTMAWIVLPAAEVVWDSAGTVISAEGRTELAPTTVEGWAEVRRNAALVAETGNLLMIPERSQGPEWVAYAAGLHAAGRRAMRAAEARDADALFDAGGALYEACVACHTRYWVRDEETGAAP